MPAAKALNVADGSRSSFPDLRVGTGRVVLGRRRRRTVVSCSPCLRRTRRANPEADLIFDAKGNLYGTTYAGGRHDYGSVFRLSQEGSEKVLHSFKSGTDGANPYAALMSDTDGNFYGTTGWGGEGDYGTIFRLAANGGETVLYAFNGGTDGGNPFAGLISDKMGNLYGTTFDGGMLPSRAGPASAPSGFTGDGTVFKLSPRGTETVLYTFTGGNDGGGPSAGLRSDKSGKLVGITDFGGTYGEGTVFSIAPDGTETVLYAFTGGMDGSAPEAGLISDKKGNLYGTTIAGGANGYGVVFELAPDGSETVLHAFAGGSDGASPVSNLIFDRTGNLYGTTSAGGSDNAGTIFRIATDRSETVIHTFTGGSDGAIPYAGLISDGKGGLYGTASEGGGAGCGGYGCGTVFRIGK